MTDAKMALIALALYGAGGAVGIGWRSWWQWRHTGSTGFRMLGGQSGLAERICALGFTVAVLVPVASTALQLRGVLSPLPLLRAGWIQAGGIAMGLAGIAGMAYAQLAMGDSWRIGVDASETTTLVRRGVFGMVRNPIYDAMLVLWLGIALVAPNIAAVAGYLVSLAVIELQVRLVEEPHLLLVHRDDYRRYARRVGRFIPGIGLIRGPSDRR